MIQILGTIVAFIIAVGILVFVHEFGHFFAAKLVGVRVEVFSFGYGKRVFGFRRGDTDYRVSILPMGGYVKLKGEGLFEPERPIDPDDLAAKSRWQRFLIMVMGSVMNLLLAVAVVAVLNGIGVSVPIYSEQAPVIGWIDPGSPAEKAGLQIDDEILRIGGSAVKTWGDVELAVGTKPDRLLPVVVRRGGAELTVDLQTESVTRYQMGYAGFKGKILTQVQMVQSGYPAEKGGLKPGDLILAIDGKPVYFYQFLQVIKANPERQLVFTIQRQGQTLELPLTPRREGEVGKVGLYPMAESEVRRYGFFAAIGQSIRENARNAFLVVSFLKDLFSGQASTRQLSGPIEIASLSYSFLQLGWLAMMSWIGMISLQLGMINLFPIPFFDGGQIFVLAVEGLRRKDLSPRARQVWLQVGFVMFVALLAFVILNDIVKWLPHGWASLVPF
ncbi:MAG: RIP metalloprotease RseP [Candidatus Aminicenantes bacterium]|nr:RIP metalloprotease RseP [Candidatus Aminicenantes bacterium]